jgi:hypothetical protein
MFTFKLEQADGTPADPPAITLAVPNMRVGDTIPIRRDATFRVLLAEDVPQPAFFDAKVGHTSGRNEPKR